MSSVDIKCNACNYGMNISHPTKHTQVERLVLLQINNECPKCGGKDWLRKDIGIKYDGQPK